jgi:hypothetical protein
MNRVTTLMSGKERALLVLQASNAGVEPDPQLRIIDDPAQARVFDRLMGLIYVINVELDCVCHGILFYAERMEETRPLEFLRDAAALVEEQSGETVDPSVVRRWRKQPKLSNPEFFYGVAEELRRLILLPDVLARCREMASLDVVWKELAQEFDGQDPRSRELVDKAEATWAKLRALVDRFDGPKKLPAADDGLVSLIRDRVDHALKYLRLVDVAR